MSSQTSRPCVAVGHVDLVELQIRVRGRTALRRDTGANERNVVRFNFDTPPPVQLREGAGGRALHTLPSAPW
jgi:hypothetical protein